MSVQLKTSNGADYFNVLRSGPETALFIEPPLGHQWTGVLPAGGDFVVRVYLMRRAARRNERADYTLTLLEGRRPASRQACLAKNLLPRDFPYFSLVTYPKPERISSALELTYKKLSRVDPRNPGKLFFYDQVIPGSHLLGYANAEHWAVAVPVSRSHSTIGTVFVDQNQYPSEALAEALLRFVEEELAASTR